VLAVLGVRIEAFRDIRFCAPWQVEQMFIISSPSVCWASANVRAFSVSASSWLCSAITPAPQQAPRSSSISSMSEQRRDRRHRACSSGVKPRLTHLASTRLHRFAPSVAAPESASPAPATGVVGSCDVELSS